MKNKEIIRFLELPAIRKRTYRGEEIEQRSKDMGRRKLTNRRSGEKHNVGNYEV